MAAAGRMCGGIRVWTEKAIGGWFSHENEQAEPGLSRGNGAERMDLRGIKDEKLAEFRGWV